MASIEMEARSPISGPGIYITAGGLCPLFANVETNKGMIGLVNVEGHDRTIEVYQWTTATDSVLLKEFSDVSGKYALTVTPSSRPTDVVLCNIPSPASPKVTDRFTSLSFVPDLEAMYEKEVVKDFSQIAAQFCFNDGAISTFSLQPASTNPTELLQVTYVNSRFPRTPSYMGLGFGIQIEFHDGDTAQLTAPDGSSIQFESTGTYYIRIENNCYDGSPGENDIQLLYQTPDTPGLIQMVSQVPGPIYPVQYSSGGEPETRDGLCTPGFFGKTLDWPEM